MEYVQYKSLGPYLLEEKVDLGEAVIIVTQENPHWYNGILRVNSYLLCIIIVIITVVKK